MGARFCPNCGDPLEADQKFCEKCGASIDESAPAPPQTVSAVKPTPSGGIFDINRNYYVLKEKYWDWGSGDILDENGIEVPSKGVEILRKCEDDPNANWIQYSINASNGEREEDAPTGSDGSTTALRHTAPGMGDSYDPDLDIFKPFIETINEVVKSEMHTDDMRLINPSKKFNTRELYHLPEYLQSTALAIIALKEATIDEIAKEYLNLKNLKSVGGIIEMKLKNG